MTTYTAPKTIYKTTTSLVAGDVISTGNMWCGFTTKTVIDVKESQYNPRMLVVTFQFSHGGIYDSVEGKNARWSVITQEAK